MTNIKNNIYSVRDEARYYSKKGNKITYYMYDLLGYISITKFSNGIKETTKIIQI